MKLLTFTLLFAGMALSIPLEDPASPLMRPIQPPLPPKNSNLTVFSYICQHIYYLRQNEIASVSNTSYVTCTGRKAYLQY
jgi:hypothetical protein